MTQTLTIVELTMAWHNATRRRDDAQDAVDLENANRREVVVRLVEHGLSHSRIGELLNLSPGRIGQIAKGGRKSQ